MRVLVTGASGLVGGRLLAELARDPEVTVRAASRRWREWPAGVESATLDSRDPASLAAACDGVDAVVNLAAMQEAGCAADPAGALMANTEATRALVAASVAAGVQRFVQMSTSKVYGSNLAGVVTEQTLTCPTSHYAITHRASEDYARLHPSAVVFRLANGFGAPVNGTEGGWGVIVNEFCRQAVRTGQIVIRSAGMAQRNFIPLSDVTSALSAARARLAPGTYNLGVRQSITMRAMAERVALIAQRMMGSTIDLSFGPPSPGGASAPLDFRSDRLREAGVCLAEQVDEEIACTLEAARR